jgi:hypothetical protein
MIAMLTKRRVAALLSIVSLQNQAGIVYTARNYYHLNARYDLWKGDMDKLETLSLIYRSDFYIERKRQLINDH